MHLEMLGGVAIGDLRDLLATAAQDDLAVVAPRRPAASRAVAGSASIKPGTRCMTSLASAREVVNSHAGDSWPCSACPTRSLATIAASADSSAITATSVGPAKTSMPTLPEQRALGLGHVFVAGANDDVGGLAGE